MRHAQNLEGRDRSITYEGTHDVHALILGAASDRLQAFLAEAQSYWVEGHHGPVSEGRP